MKIKKVSYNDKANKWSFENVKFPDIALLVGVSGVGKTKILDNIFNLKRIANGKSFEGVKWSVEFETTNGNEYLWEGEFENKYSENLTYLKDLEKDEVVYNSVVLFEKLLLNNKIIAERNKDSIFFRQKETVKLSPYKSLLDILKEDEIVYVQDEFNKIIRSNYRMDSNSALYPNLAEIMGMSPTKKAVGFKDSKQLENLKKQFDMISKKNKYNKDKKESKKEIEKKIEKLENILKDKIFKSMSNLPLVIKIGISYRYLPERFEQIKETFIDIFEQVEDIKIDFPHKENLPNNIKKIPVIQIKEKNVDKWILQFDMSSGMFKTLLQISQIVLSEEGSIFLIDEFENSLGVNCIDILTDELLTVNNSQCILTSHHPYIINNIDMKFWEIVTRKGGQVSVKNAQEFNLGKSKHQAFLQLINLRAYKEGIDL